MNDAFVHLVFVILLGVVVAIEAKHKLLPRYVPLEVLLLLSVCLCVREREIKREACLWNQRVVRQLTTHSLNPRRTHLPA
jgi:hypothetical protein